MPPMPGPAPRPRPPFLIADPDPESRALLERVAHGLGATPVAAGSGAELAALSAANRRSVGVVDLSLAAARLAGATAAGPPTVLLVDSCRTSAAEALRLRARPSVAGVLFRPLRAAEAELALAQALALGEDARAEPRAGGDRAEDVLLGGSPEAQRLREQIQRIAAASNTTVLLQGERGTAKEDVARVLHARSERAGGRFARVDEGLLRRRPASAFEECARPAQHGTLFLREVGALGPDEQADLCAFLEDRVRPPHTKAVREGVDTRLIAATRHDLEERVSAGRLREDLFYRINVLTLRVPPLRERRADVPVLAERAARRATEAFGVAFGGFTAAACQALQEHGWPGNLRELAAVVERAVLVADGESVAPKHLAWPTAPRAESGDERVAWVPLGERSLRSVEERLIRRVLEEVDGNRSRAAKVLGINRTTLYNKLRLYGIG